MALRNQPYFPFYVDDFLADEKLSMCSAEAYGVYIVVMCLMHKSDSYGSILLKQKFKQNTKQILNFAYMFAKQMPFDVDVIERGLTELIDENVLTLDEDTLYQKRMVRDGKLSDTRALAGSKGGKSSTKKQGKKEKFCSSKIASKTQANTVTVIVNENEDVNVSGNDGNVSDFDKFWDAYPRKVGKGEARKAFAKVDVDVAVLLAAIAEQKKSAQWKKDNGQYIPNPSTWLNQGRWEDELQDGKQNAGGADASAKWKLDKAKL